MTTPFELLHQELAAAGLTRGHEVQYLTYRRTTSARQPVMLFKPNTGGAILQIAGSPDGWKEVANLVQLIAAKFSASESLGGGRFVLTGYLREPVMDDLGRPWWTMAFAMRN